MDQGSRVLVAMSGGVDSAVAAYLLIKSGYECIGATMRLFSGGACAADARKAAECGAEDARNAAECGAEDARNAAECGAEDARKAAECLGIPHIVLDLRAKFEREVVRRFADSYMAGMTPNPCVECNRYIKFGELMRCAGELGADFVATGHYAGVADDPETGRRAIVRARDRSKDQSYVLSMLSQDELSRVMLPLGEMTKGEVREIARQIGLSNHDRPESQDICFIPGGDYGAFLEEYTGAGFSPGDIVSADGSVIGRHRGAARYTLGQRRGLGISSDKRLYVTAKSMESNTVTLGSEEELYSRSLTMGDIVYGAIAGIEEPVRAAIVTRYRQRETPCTVYDEGGGRLRAQFDTPVRAVTPGQAAVLYGGDRVLAAGTILSTEK